MIMVVFFGFGYMGLLMVKNFVVVGYEVYGFDFVFVVIDVV